MRTLLAGRHQKLLRAVTNRLLLTRALSGDSHYDVIIGGGGLVGTTLAAAFSSNTTLRSKRVLLLEGAPAFKGFDARGQYRNRVSAINNKTIELFKTIGVWEHIECIGARVKPVKQMQVWDASSDSIIKFQNEHFAKDVACIVENDLMLDAVYGLLKNSKNVTIKNEARIENVELPVDNESKIAVVTLKGGEKYTADLIVGADGANSVVRNAMGIDVYSMNYERMGLVATLELEEAGDNSVAWQRFLPNGPIALLPLNDTISSLVWSTSVPHAKELLQLQPEKFVDELNHAFCQEYAKNDLVVKAIGGFNSLLGTNQRSLQYPPRVCSVIDNSRALFPLGFLHASSYVSTGTALIGDAAHRVHPLAGQGVNLGFSDVGFLIDSLADGAYSGAPIGDKRYLLRYEQKCLMHNIPIMIGIHGLHTLYSTSFTPVVLLRSFGLQLTDQIPVLKNIFMQRAMG